TQETVDARALARSNESVTPRWRIEREFPMPSRAASIILLVLSFSAAAHAGDYRGMPAGWPYTQTGYVAGYPSAGGVTSAYIVARPASAPYYAGRAPVVTYMPATVAYSNPSYVAGYGAAPVTAYRPTVAAAGYYQPTTAYYAPVTAAYAPSYSYAI